jgi:drug/metabolite transporter (DMT)-like permease
VLAGSQAVGLLAVLALVAAAHRPPPQTGAIALAVAAGMAELLGFAALYRGLARGPMGVVAPLSAIGGAVPLALAVAGGRLPGAAAAAGLALALCGIALVSCEPRRGPGALASGCALGVAASLGFGAFFVLTDAATRAGDPTWVVGVNRAASVAVLSAVLAARGGRRGDLRRGDLPALAAIGALDAGANALFAVALTHGAGAVVSVLGSLYPLTTVALAQLLLRERLTAAQAAGALATLTGVALVAVHA